MGIGGAVLYSLAFMAVRALLSGDAFAARSLRWLGRASPVFSCFRIHYRGACRNGARGVRNMMARTATDCWKHDWRMVTSRTWPSL